MKGRWEMTSHGSEADAKEFSIDVLTDEGMKLLRMEVDELYATLGAQLVAQKFPTRVAGIVSYLSAIRSASDAKSFYETLPSGPALADWGSALGVIYDDLKQDGMALFEEISENLRKTLCNEDILRLSDQVNRSIMQIVVLLVGACLGMPRQFEPIAVTVSAILFKLGLRNFCSQTEGLGRGPSRD